MKKKVPASVAELSYITITKRPPGNQGCNVGVALHAGGIVHSRRRWGGGRRSRRRREGGIRGWRPIEALS